MSYHLLPEQAARLKQMSLDGRSVRQMVKATGHAKNTVMNHRALALGDKELFCKCGKPLKHQGWCAFRFANSEERKRFMARWYKEKCVDCGGPRHYAAGARCKRCYRDRVERNALERVTRTKPCRICHTAIPAYHNPRRVCGSVWCERMGAFYRNRALPSSARGAKTNELRFDLLMADYLRRFAWNPNSLVTRSACVRRYSRNGKRYAMVQATPPAPAALP